MLELHEKNHGHANSEALRSLLRKTKFYENGTKTLSPRGVRAFHTHGTVVANRVPSTRRSGKVCFGIFRCAGKPLKNQCGRSSRDQAPAAVTRARGGEPLCFSGTVSHFDGNRL